MKNEDKWIPTKALFKNKKLIPNLRKIYGASYHVIKLQLSAYDFVLKKFAKGRLADLGCGAVPYFECYRTNISSVTCADRFENDFTDTIIDLNSTFPFESNCFDSVLFSDVINHVYDTDNLFSESFRILKPNGHLIIFTPFLYWISEAPNDFHRFTRFFLLKKCADHNMEVIELRSYGGRRDVILDLLFKKLYSRFSFHLLKAVSDLYFKKNTFSSGSEAFPLGYVLVARKK